MTHDDRIQATALITLLAALLGALWALQRGCDVQGIALAAGLAYGAALALTGPLQAPLGESVMTSLKYVGLALAFAVSVLISSMYAGWQALRGRAPKGAFA